VERYPLRKSFFGFSPDADTCPQQSFVHKSDSAISAEKIWKISPSPGVYKETAVKHPRWLYLFSALRTDPRGSTFGRHLASFLGMGCIKTNKKSFFGYEFLFD